MTQKPDKRALRAVQQAEKERERAAREVAVAQRTDFEGLQVQPEGDYYEEAAVRTPGDTNIVKWGFDLHPQVTFASAGFLIVFLALTLIFQESAEAAFGSALNFIGANFGWFYIVAANIMLVAVAFFGFSRYGRIRLGGQGRRS